MILVLAGTAEGRQTARLLRESGLRVTVSVVTGYGAELHHMDETGAGIIQGTFDGGSLARLLREKRVSAVVDATHPYAAEISRLAIEAAAVCDAEYIRLERESCRLPPSTLVKWFTDIAEIESFLRKGLNVFSTMGSKNLSLLSPIVDGMGANLTVRVLPVVKSLEACKSVGINPANIVAAKGPFPKYLNKALFKYYRADLVLTKESGSTGGFREKVEAALELDIPVLVQTRPKINYPRLVNTPRDVVNYLNCVKRNRKGGF
ncbi:MAG TPA: precorrin-6A reductase [Clostridia bacterium]|nr:precorrin-6A reductase [Clostridia bacterium]